MSTTEDMAAGVNTPHLRPCYLTREEAVRAGVEKDWDYHGDDDCIVALDHLIALSERAQRGKTTWRP